MSLMWIPAQTTCRPADGRERGGTSAPPGAKMIAASSCSGGGVRRPPTRAELAREACVGRPAREREDAPALVTATWQMMCARRRSRRGRAARVAASRSAR
jgi:hypothetical protein